MLQRIKLENWRSHKKTELEFGEGTNVLVGSIGSGKSSVMNAVCFALFGTFPELQRREATLNEVIMKKPTKTNQATIELEFEYREKNYKIERKLYRNGKTNTAKLYEDQMLLAGPKISDVNQRIEQLLELNYDLFSRAVYSEQNQMDFFIRLSPGERKQKFDELLELDKYEQVRKNAVSVKNTLKKTLDERKDFLKDQKSDFEPKELGKIHSEIKKIKEKIKEKAKQKEKSKEKMKELGKKVKELKEKRKEFNSLKEKKIGLVQSIKSIEEEIKKTEKETSADLEKIEQKEVKKELEEIESKKRKLKNKKEELNQLKSELQAKKTKIESLEEENKNTSKRLPEKVSGKEELLKYIKETVEKRDEFKKQKTEKEKKLQELQKKETHLSEKISVNQSKEKEEQSNLEKIEKEKANCPLCKRPLTKELRQDLINRTESHLNELEVENKKAKRKLEETREKKEKIKEKINKIQEEINTLNELKSFLNSLREPLERMEKNIEKMKKLNSKTEKMKKNKKELEKTKIDKKTEELEENKKLLEKLLNALEKREKLIEKNTELKKIKQKLKKLDFNEEKAMKTERSLEQKKESINSLTKEIENQIELVEEKQKREKEINSKKELIEKTQKKISSLDYGVEKLGIFINALKATQSELRESMVETINEAMNTVWTRVYPYGDYVSAKMEINQGNYELMVKSPTGNWNKIEGSLSGGERSAVALTLRIAFSLVLARNLSILILDEPTHNLDETAVTKLSEMMHEHLSGLINQVFLITHDKRMEKAANASLYLLKRNKEKEGITKTELSSTEH